MPLQYVKDAKINIKNHSLTVNLCILWWKACEKIAFNLELRISITWSYKGIGIHMVNSAEPHDHDVAAVQ